MSFFEVIINEAIIDDVIEYSEMVISMCRWIEFDLLGALSPQIIHYPLLWPNRIKVWDEIPVEEQDKGLQVLIMSEKGREGGRADPFHWHSSLGTDNFAYVIQVYLLCSNFANKNKRVLTV